LVVWGKLSLWPEMYYLYEQGC